MSNNKKVTSAFDVFPMPEYTRNNFHGLTIDQCMVIIQLYCKTKKIGDTDDFFSAWSLAHIKRVITLLSAYRHTESGAKREEDEALAGQGHSVFSPEWVSILCNNQTALFLVVEAIVADSNKNLYPISPEVQEAIDGCEDYANMLNCFGTHATILHVISSYLGAFKSKRRRKSAI